MSADFLSSLIIRQLPAELAERNSTISGHMVGSKCDLKMHVWIVGIPSAYKSGAQKLPFLTISQLKGNLTAYVFGKKHDIAYISEQVCCKLQGIYYVRLKTTWTLVHKRLQIGSEFSSTLRKFCIPLHCQASQMEISKRNSSKLYQTVGGKCR